MDKRENRTGAAPPKKNLYRRTVTLSAGMLFAQAALILLALLGTPPLRLLIWGLVFLAGEAIAAWFYLLRPYSRLNSLEERICRSRSLTEPADADAVFSPQDEQLKRMLFSSMDHQERLRLEVKQSEYLALQNQINPHFLYNTLEAIRSDALIYGIDTIAEITQQMAGFFRYAISSLDHFVTLEEELHHVEVYVNIQRYRFGPGLRLEIQSHLESGASPYRVPKMILQPIVENAIFHGLEAKEHLGVISITIDRTETELCISIRDNGIGMDASTAAKLNESFQSGSPSEGHGIALHNVNNRISLLFGEEYGLQVFSVVNIGTEVRINLPASFEENRDDK